jgi:hypothetical protein
MRNLVMRIVHVLSAAAIPALLLSLAPVALAEPHVSGSNAITVAPGETGTCATSPCQVTLQMPPGEGSYEVTGNEVLIGTYPAGQAVNLGNYFESQAFEVKGAGVKKAYVYMPQDM